MTVFWDVASCSLVEIYRRFRGTCCLHQGDPLIALMMEVANSSETSVNLGQTTWRNIREDSHLHSRCRENLKSHQILTFISSTPLTAKQRDRVLD
jgi:hypothetical protein